MIEKIESNVNYFINILETKIKKELQKISNEYGLIIDIDIENQILEVYDKNDKEVFGPIYQDIYRLMSVWWCNIKDMGNFLDLKIKPKD